MLSDRRSLRTLHLPTVRSRFEDVAATALKERASYKDFLADPLEAECLQREERKKTRLVREAGFPRPKRLEDFEFDKNPNFTPEQVNTLSDPAWVIGDSGTGKSHLLIGIGTAIAEAEMRVRYTTTANLVNELAEAADETSAPSPATGARSGSRPAPAPGSARRS
ncbi:ATP-binding protein [Streptomyces sp. NPDC056069]|uniref:ATP-binding protein n=1 Tax=Streptomyces sp. NPDC056069 TaxID=3345702 RepID=UPI0035DDF40B